MQLLEVMHTCMASSLSSSGTTSMVRQPNVFLLRRMSPYMWSPMYSTCKESL